MLELSIYCILHPYHHLSRIYTSKNHKNAHTAPVLISINDKNHLSLVVGIKKTGKSFARYGLCLLSMLIKNSRREIIWFNNLLVTHGNSKATLKCKGACLHVGSRKLM